MKKILFLALLLSLVFAFSNCKKEVKEEEEEEVPTTPTTANIAVTISIFEDETQPVNCNGLSVELHTNSLYTNKAKSTTSAGTATAATASFTDVPNGKYYLIAWKDMDASSSYTTGDLFGFVETPVVINGANLSKEIKMYVL